MFRKLLLATLFFVICTINAQITGVVKSEKGESLPFVNVYLESGSIGTTTNGDGFYELALKSNTPQTIVFQFLGYQTEKVDFDGKNMQQRIDVVMKETSTSLDEVVVEAGVNPADRIIRETIANRKKNLDKLGEYTADFYSRGIWRVKDAPEKILGQEVGDLGGGLDSTRTGIIYLSETISEIAYQRPDNFSETIQRL